MLASQVMKFVRPPRDHQLEVFDWCAPKPNVALFWEMGTGKTTEAILWLRYKYTQEKNLDRTLIVAPVATLYNWTDEFRLNAPPVVADSVFVPYMRTRKMKFTGVERAKAIRETESRIITINPESLDNDDVVQALLLWKPVNLIVDEIHRFKGHEMTTGSKNKETPSRLARLLSISDRCENRMGLSGTPILNSYLDLWAQFRIIDGGKAFGRNFYSFRETYFEDKNLKWKGNAKYFPDWQPKAKCAELVSEKIAAISSRKTQAECLDLPELIFEKCYVEMDEDQSRAYYQMETQMITEVNNGVCAAVNALSKVNRLLQILSGHLPVEHDLHGDKVLTYFKNNSRMKLLEEKLLELTPEHKVIVWSTFQASYPRLRELFKKIGIEWSEVVGGTKDRQGEIERFRDDPKCRVMLSHPKAGGVGVNMTRAKYAIYYSRDYALGDRLQSLKRNHRDGCQDHDRLIVLDLVVRDTMDEEVLEALLRKENFSENVLDRIRKLR